MDAKETKNSAEAGRQAVLPKLYGEPLADLPKDLFIPPDALEVFFEAFEGPLDLLLYLIRKSNIDILDIPMAKLTEQYLCYIDEMRRRNLDLAADYLLMAAMLLEIKSRMLLPQPARIEEDDAEDPRADLVRRLIEYEQIKSAAQSLDALDMMGRDFEWVSVWVEACQTPQRQPDVSIHDLQAAWLSVMKTAQLNRSHQVQRESLSVREHMTLLLRKLSADYFSRFETLLNPEEGVASVVVNFLAILELMKEHLIELNQARAGEPIYVKLSYGHHAAA